MVEPAGLIRGFVRSAGSFLLSLLRQKTKTLEREGLSVSKGENFSRGDSLCSGSAAKKTYFEILFLNEMVRRISFD